MTTVLIPMTKVTRKTLEVAALHNGIDGEGFLGPVMTRGMDLMVTTRGQQPWQRRRSPTTHGVDLPLIPSFPPLGEAASVRLSGTWW